MCILAQPLESVSNTAIYAGTNTDQTRQCVVYQMAVELRGPNAMILPVPAPADSIQLIDMTEYPLFFDDLRDIFRERTRGFTKSLPAAATLDYLEVMDVGSYKVSVASTIEDLNRINPNVFTVSPAVDKLLRFFYSSGYSFVVAQLTESGDYHPLAYSHDIGPEGLFIPTRHQHGKGGAREMRIADDWDHQVYHHPAGPLVFNPRRITDQVRRADRALPALVAKLMLKVPELVDYLPLDRLSRKRVKGEGRNIDMLIAL